MSTRVFLPEAGDPMRVVDAAWDIEPDQGFARPRSDRSVSASGLKGFCLGLGVTMGCTVGLATRNLLILGGLARAVDPTMLGFCASVFGLSFCHMLARLMDRARESTIRVVVDGEKKEFPLRRRHEVVRRALFYLSGILGGFAVALGAGWYSLQETLPALQRLTLQPTPDLLATGVALGSAVACLGFAEWSLRVVRKEGHDDQAPWVIVPAMLALGATLAHIF